MHEAKPLFRTLGWTGGHCCYFEQHWRKSWRHATNQRWSQGSLPLQVVLTANWITHIAQPGLIITHCPSLPPTVCVFMELSFVYNLWIIFSFPMCWAMPLPNMNSSFFIILKGNGYIHMHIGWWPSDYASCSRCLLLHWDVTHHSTTDSRAIMCHVLLHNVGFGT